MFDTQTSNKINTVTQSSLDPVVASQKWISFLIFCLSLLLFTFGLSAQEIIGFESRFYVFAKEMLHHGPSLFPTTYGEFYPDYPSLGTFLIDAMAKITGHLNKTIAVFPTAIASAITLVYTYQIGALHGRALGAYAAGFLLLTVGFMCEARTIALDAYGLAITTLCFYHVYSAMIFQKSPSFRMIGFLWILGFAFRGPIGFIIPASLVFTFYLIQRDKKYVIRTTLLSLILLIVCCSVFFGAAYEWGGRTLFDHVVTMEVTGRLQDHQAPPFYYYWVDGVGAYLITYPLFLFAAGRMIFCKTASFPRLLKACLGWGGILLIGLTFVADKKWRYILPAAPAFSLVSAMVCYRALQRWISLRIIGVGLMVLLWSAQILYVEPRLQQMNRTYDYVGHLAQLQHRLHQPILFEASERDALAIKYLVPLAETDYPGFVDNVQTFASNQMAGLLVLPKDRILTMSKAVKAQLKIVEKGKIGHTDVVIWVNKSARPPVAVF